MKQWLPTILLAASIGCSDPDSDSQSTDGDSGASVTDPPAIDCDADSDGVDGAQCGGLDCDDDNPARHHGAEELCNGIDEDCDEFVDENAADASTWYTDTDDDGYGSDSSARRACDQPAGTVSTGGDSDDNDPTIYPGAPDCLETWYRDSDGDGYGRSWTSVTACDEPAGHVDQAGDCQDWDASISPEADEVCGDGVDNNCDGGDADCEICGDGLDNDSDGLIDCEDAECSDDCGEICGDLIDNDDDGWADCHDDECWEFSDCDVYVAEVHGGRLEMEWGDVGSGVVLDSLVGRMRHRVVGGAWETCSWMMPGTHATNLEALPDRSNLQVETGCSIDPSLAWPEALELSSEHPLPWDGAPVLMTSARLNVWYGGEPSWTRFEMNYYSTTTMGMESYVITYLGGSAHFEPLDRGEFRNVACEGTGLECLVDGRHAAPADADAVLPAHVRDMAADFDGDGVAELLQVDGDAFAFLDLPTGIDLGVRVQNPVGLDVFLAEDVTGNGHVDLVHQTGVLAGPLSDGTALGAADAVSWTLIHDSEPFGVGEVNGDGTLDLVLRRRGGEGVDLVVGPMTGAKTPLSMIECVGAGPLDHCDVEVMEDFDGDGRAELVVKRWGGRAYIHMDLDPAAGLRDVSDADVFIDLSAAPLGDADGDGLPDLVVGHGVALAPFSAGEIETGDLVANFGRQPRPAGDVNGDGMTDLMLQHEHLHLAPFVGSLRWSNGRINLPWSGSDVPVGDVNSDGVDDILTKRLHDGTHLLFYGSDRL